MLICLCKAVSDRDLRRAIGHGAGNVQSLCNKTGAGSECGSCKVDLHAMLKDARINARSVAVRRSTRHG